MTDTPHRLDTTMPIPPTLDVDHMNYDLVQDFLLTHGLVRAGVIRDTLNAMGLTRMYALMATQKMPIYQAGFGSDGDALGYETIRASFDDMCHRSVNTATRVWLAPEHLLIMGQAGFTDNDQIDWDGRCTCQWQTNRYYPLDEDGEQKALAECREHWAEVLKWTPSDDS